MFIKFAMGHTCACTCTHMTVWSGANLLFKRLVGSHIKKTRSETTTIFLYVYVVKILHGSYVVYTNLHSFPFNNRISIHIIINSVSLLNFCYCIITSFVHFDT